MRWPQRLSIRRKLMLALMLTAGVGLLIASAAFVVHDLFVLRRAMHRQLTVLADVLGDNATAALTFRDADAATDVLDALRSHPRIVAAAVYGADGRVFARYQRATGGDSVPAIVGNDGARLGPDRLTIFRPIVFNDRHVGAIYLHSDLSERDERLRLHALVVGVVLVAAWIALWLVSARVQRLVSEPILALTETARAIAERKDFALRAEKTSPDEIGELTDSFNAMLAEIQTRDNRLRQAYDALLKEVAERQQAEEALRLDEARLEALVNLNQMSDTPLQELTDFALEEGVRLTGSQIGYLAFLNEDETVLTMHSWSQYAMKHCNVAGMPRVYPVAETGLWGEAVRQRRPVITNDYHAPDVPGRKGIPEGHLPLTRHMNIPVFDGPKIVAVAGVGNKAEPYDGTDVRQLTLLMQGMWRIVQHRRAEEELRQHRDQLEQIVASRTAELRHEVAERRLAEDRLRRERDRAQNYLDVVGVMMVVINPDETVGLVNRAGAALLGAPEAEIVGQNWFERFLPVHNRAAVRGVFQQLMAGETKLPEHFENMVVTATGTERLIAWHNILLRDDAGRVTGVLSSGEDITERHRAEQQLKRALADLERSNKELEQFAYVASHDLREPLRMVASYVQLLAKRYQGRLDKDADQFIAFAVDGARRMQALIDDLLQYARIGSRGKTLEPVECDRVLAVVLNNLEVAITEAHASVHVAGPLPTVRGDDTQLTQLFQNLVNNALKFRRADTPPRVEIGATRRGEHWLFRVSDNGIGIESQYHERIFVIFQRLHTRDQYPGTGIGLALCKRIVERHGGRIWVESAAGHGATFLFTLPALEDSAA